jgi:CubicO group peptidase (beta-lactamase class C family)
MALQLPRRPYLARACAVALLAVFLRPAGAADLRQQIDSLAQPLIEDGTAVGFVVGVVRDGQTLILGFGETVKASQTAPDGDTLFEIGSISKVFTCSLLADMVERGLVKLDDPVQQYLPDDVKMPVAQGQPIKLVDLATHASGLPRLPDNLRPADLTNPYADYGDQQLFAFLNGHKLRRPPGKYEYSNLGMGLLGVVLARRAGTSYEQLLTDRITGPLAMNDTRITLDEAHRKRLATAYNAALEPTKPWDFQAMAGAGAIRSTARDMLKFAAANLDGGDAPLAKTFRLAQTKRCDADGGLAIGLGWFIARDGAMRWHSGATAGYHAWLGVVPQRQVGVVVLANKETGRITQLGELVMRAALGQDVQPLPPYKPIPPRKEIAVDPAILVKYAGVYQLPAGLDLTISVEDGKLMLHTGQPKVQLFAESPTEFFFKVLDAQVTFVPDQDGNVTKLIIGNSGQRVEAARKK